MNDRSPLNIIGTDDWSISEGKIDGAHYIVRMRSNFPSAADQAL